MRKGDHAPAPPTPGETTLCSSRAFGLQLGDKRAGPPAGPLPEAPKPQSSNPLSPSQGAGILNLREVPQLPTADPLHEDGHCSSLERGPGPLTPQSTKDRTPGALSRVSATRLVAWSHPTLCDPVDHRRPGSSVHGMLQARTLEWVAMPSSRGLPHPGVEPGSPPLQADSLATEPSAPKPWSWNLKCSFILYLKY